MISSFRFCPSELRITHRAVYSGSAGKAKRIAHFAECNAMADCHLSIALSDYGASAVVGAATDDAELMNL